MSQPFETLSRQDKATLVAKAFNINRNTVLYATVDSMNAAWAAKDKGLLARQDGTSLFAELGGPQVPAAEPVVGGLTEEDVKRIASILDKANEQTLLRGVQDLIKKAIQPRIETVVVKADGQEVKPKGKQHKQFGLVFRSMQRRDNVWLAGPSGTGKTHLAIQIAETLQVPHFRVSCGPQFAASTLFGHQAPGGDYVPGIAYRWITAPEGAVLILDEWDRMNPQVAVMANGILDGHSITFPNGETLTPSPRHMVIVAANTFGFPTAEFQTAQKQDRATMNRFAKILIDTDEQLERDVFGNNEWVLYVQKVRRVVRDLGVTSLAVTPRCSEYGARALAQGEKRSDVEDLYLWNGTPHEDVVKIKARLGWDVL